MKHQVNATRPADAVGKLECNPNGQWAWLEDAAGLPITAAIADLLESGASRHDRPSDLED
ncbi:hypothetical protein AADR41_23270 [Streptomyces sp. CLV115]|uniref:hypothetical protein n=1 Tax=Streptomyces sp. CLV115 TaxID=3138502 RepID=UPI00313BC5C3